MEFSEITAFITHLIYKIYRIECIYIRIKKKYIYIRI